MKYVINGTWGGYSVPDEVRAVLGCNRYDENVRTNPTFVNWVLAHSDTTDLEVVEIPKEATDWELEEYDGLESIIAVINGKIVHLSSIE